MQDDHLITALIHSNETLTESVKATNDSVDKLAQSVEKLVLAEAKRDEREKIQIDKNKKYDKFVADNEYNLVRLDRNYKAFDRHFDKVIAAILIAVLLLTASNIDFKKIGGVAEQRNGKATVENETNKN